MRNTPTPHLTRKRNRKHKNAPLYYVEVAIEFWPIRYPDWKDKTELEKQDATNHFANNLSDFLNMKRPRRRVGVFFSPKEMIRFRVPTADERVLVTPL